MNTVIKSYFWFSIWSVVVFAFMGLFHIAQAQETNGLVLTNMPPSGSGNPIPDGVDSGWLMFIPPITFTLTWLVGKIPPLPKVILPWITPLLGVIVGAMTNWATKANLPWWSSAGAGAIAVALFEAAKGITKAGPESALTPTQKPPSP